MGIQLNGIGVSKGIALGKAHILHRDDIEVVKEELPAHKVNAEVQRYQRAIRDAKHQLQSIGDSIPETAPTEVGEFIATHLLMLEDAMFSEAPVRIIREQACNAEWALRQQLDSIIRVFESMEDDYLKTRVDDINHIAQLILRTLTKNNNPLIQTPPEIDHWQGDIIIADDLSPADTVLLQHMGIAGFVTESGGQLSHTAILARSLGIPAIVGVHQARRYVADGERLIIDGELGLTLGQATRQETGHFLKKQRRFLSKRRKLKLLIETPCITACGEPINLQANIDSENDIDAMHQTGLSGVGLYRTEFLYLNREDVPDEETHYTVYRQLIRKLTGAPLTIRTVDLGADKLNKHLAPDLIAHHNPALGLRGIRYCLHNPRLIIPQLRAILRAACHGPVQILLPMITHVSEVHELKNLIESVKSELKGENIAFKEDVRLGGMIEVPSAALTVQHLAAHLDFLSIGTNDLIQYTLAVDRTDDTVDYLFDPLSPAVLTLIKRTIDTGKKYNIPVSMCGEMAGNPRYTRLLLGLGLRAFSTPPRASLEIKKVILDTSLEDLEFLTQAILEEGSSTARTVLINSLNNLSE